MILLVGTVIAGVGISLNDRDIDLSDTEKDALTNINLDSYATSDFSQVHIVNGSEVTLYKRCLNKVNAINTCSGYMNESSLDSWEETRIKGIATATINRNSKTEELKVSEGTTTIRRRNK